MSDVSKRRTERKPYKFECRFCGRDFGPDVVQLALHIRRVHDSPRE